MLTKGMSILPTLPREAADSGEGAEKEQAEKFRHIVARGNNSIYFGHLGAFYVLGAIGSDS